MKTIAQGAEAIITLAKPSSKTATEITNPRQSRGSATLVALKDKAAELPNIAAGIITKNRIQKSYRHPILDEKIRKSRTKKEAKLLEKAGKLTKIPKVLKTDKFKIQMQYINGEKLSETLNTYSKNKQLKIMQQLGKQVAKLHQAEIIHGDLTTSNIILSSKSHNPIKNNKFLNLQGGTNRPLNKQAKIDKLAEGEELFIIDFGLGFISSRFEDKAVDLHLISQALEAKHWQNHKQLFKEFLKSYNPDEKTKILEQLKKVEARGRYKH